MFLYIGGEYEIAFKEIVFIIDYEKCENKITSEFIENAKKNGKVIYSSNDSIKSIICVNTKNNENLVYLSNISAIALKRRYNNLNKALYKN